MCGQKNSKWKCFLGTSRHLTSCVKWDGSLANLCGTLPTSRRRKVGIRAESLEALDNQLIIFQATPVWVEIRREFLRELVSPRQWLICFGSDTLS